MTCKCDNNNIFEKQKEFMEACDQSTSYEDLNNYKEFHLWAKLINEEHAELNEALLAYVDIMLENDSAEQVVSEAIDLIYVTSGLLNNMGVDGMAVFNAIHNANMAKVGEDGKVIKNKDGKVLKPEGWTKADIKGVLDADS